MKKTLSVVAIGLGLITLPVFAQNALPPKEIRRDLRQEAKEERIEYLQQRRDDRQNLKEEIQEKRKAILVEMKADKDRLKLATSSEERMRIKEEIKAKAEELREENKKKREEFQKKREEALTTFREKVKDVKERALRISEFSRLNLVVNRFRALDARYSNIIERIDTKLTKLKMEGVDTLAFEQSLANIKMKKEGLSTLIEELKSKITTVIEQGDKETIKKEIQAAVEKLKASGKEIKEDLQKLTSSIQAGLNQTASTSTATSFSTQ
jgi:hypothetical protein